MTSFHDLPVQYKGKAPSQAYVRFMVYKDSDAERLGGLTAIRVEDYTGRENAGLDAAAPISQKVTAEVNQLIQDGKLPSTAKVNYGNSHVTVSETSYGDDDIFAIWDEQAF